MKQELKNLLRLFTDWRQPYLYGMMTAISIIVGSLLHLDFMLYIIIASFALTVFAFFYHFVSDQIERAKLGQWKLQAVFLLWVITCVIAYFLLN